MAIDFSYSPQEASDSEVDFSYSPEAVKPKKQNKGIVADLATDLKRGVQNIPSAVTGLADIPVAAVTGSPLISAAAEGLGKMTGFQPGQWAKDAEQEYSEGRKQARQNIDAAWKDGTAGDIASAYLQNPSQIAGSIVESLPSMLAGGLAGRAALGIGGRAVSAGAGGVGPVLPGAIARTVGEKLAPAVGAGLGEGAVMAGQAMDNLTEQGVDPRTAAGYAAGTGIVGAALGAGGGKVAQMLGVVDPETAIAGGAARAIREGASASKWQVAKETGKNIIGGGISEGIFEELPQSVMEQGLSNLAQGKPIGEGVARAGVEGALAGFGMGAGFNAIPARQEPQGPLSRSVEAGKQSGAIQEQPLALGYNANVRTDGAPLYTYPDGSTLTQAEYEQRQAAEEKQRLDGMVQDAPLTRMAERAQERASETAPDRDLAGLIAEENNRLAPIRAGLVATALERQQARQEKQAVRDQQGDGSFSTMNEFADLLNSERQQVESSRRAIAAKQALRRESDLESADARVADSMAKESEQKRRSVLESVLADPAVQNHAAKFSAELKRQGFRNFTPTESELSSITRFGDILNAKPETTTEPSLPNEATAEQLGIKERKEPSQAQGSQRDKIAEVQQLVSAGWKVNGRTLVSPTGKKRNLNFAERYAAVKAQQEKRGNATQVKPLAQEATQANDEEARTQPAAAPEAERVSDAQNLQAPAQAEQTGVPVQGIDAQSAPVQQAADVPKPAPVRTVKKAGPQNRDDLVGAILRVTGNKGISAGMAQTITGDKAGSGNAKLRGLFTNDGIADLDDTAELLRTEEGYDVRDGNHLAELIREQSAGNAVYSMERTEREAQENAEKEYKASVNQKATELGLKKVGGKRTLQVVEAEILAKEQEINRLEAEAERQAIQAADVLEDGEVSEAEFMRLLSQTVGYTEEEINAEVVRSQERADRKAEALSIADSDEQAQGSSREGDGNQPSAQGTGSTEAGARSTESLTDTAIIDRAKALGMKTAGVSAEKLAKQVEEAEFNLTQQTNAEASAEYKQQQEEANKKDEEPAPNVTADQVDMFNTQGSLIDNNRDAGKQADPVADGEQSRDSYLVKRFNGETNQIETESFARGEYVRIASVDAGAKGNESFGEIIGISHAKKEANIGGVWYSFGQIYKATKPDAPSVKKVSLDSVIDDVNAKNGEGLTEADRVPRQYSTMADVDSAITGIYDGTVSLEDYKAAFNGLLANKEAITAELGKMTIPQLHEKFGKQPYGRPEKKGEIVERAFEAVRNTFSLRRSYGRNSYSMGRGEYEKYLADNLAALTELVNASTAKDLKKFADEIGNTRAARQEKVAAAQDPKTIEDFDNALRLKKAEGMTFAEARMSLTPEQRAEYDRLKGIESRDQRKARADQQKTDVRVASQTTDGQVVETKHTKTGEPLFVVKAAERVDRDIYNLWNTTAKRMGGYYSSFRGNGAVPGFQFKTRENADAFLAFIGGNAEAAKEVVQERRDAFADDSSQSAIERLNEMAERLEEKADESLGRERKANTERRARFAASAEAAANAEKAMATTMRRIASAISDGTTKFLDRVRQKAQIEYLASVLRTAKYAEARAKFPQDWDRNQRHNEPATGETADYAEFPQYAMMRSDLANLARKMVALPNMKMLGQRILKAADDTSTAYNAFAKEHLLEVSRFGKADGSGWATFSTIKDAERSIEVSNLTAVAVPLQIKRGEYRLVLSPSEAINRGIWKGDDRKMYLSPEMGEEIVEKLGRLNRRHGKRRGMDAPPEAPWQFENAYNNRKRLAGLGIEQPWEFRAALREFAELKESPKEADKIKAMERAMIGRKNDGLDFFPTPADTAQAMIDAAEITEGMSVLEPSAGMGHIAEKIRNAGNSPDVIEFNSDRRELLEAKGFNVVGSDFLEADGRYDRIIMNPPFSNRRDAEHVQHAYSLLKPGGRIVAIMGEGVFFGQDKKAQDFREWLDGVGGTSEKLADGTFLDPSLPVNTGTNARMVVINKPADALYSKGDETVSAPMPQSQAEQRIKSLFGDKVARLLIESGIVSFVNRGNAYQGATFENGNIVLNLDALSADNFDGVLLHEGFHSTIKQLVGEETYAKLMKQLNNMLAMGRGAQWVKDANAAVPKKTAPENVTEEIAAYAIEQHKNGGKIPSVLQRWVQSFLSAIRTAIIQRMPNGKLKNWAVMNLKAQDLANLAMAGLKAKAAGQLQAQGREAMAYSTAFGKDSQHRTPLGDATEIEVDGIKRPALNSNGKPIHWSREGVENFWRWFSDSKVVDAEGRPLVVYHGTAKDFTKFDLSKSGESTGNTGFYGAGAYFSEDGEDAGGYALWARKDEDDAANVIPAYLSLKDPLYLHINPKDDARKDKARASLGRIVDQLLSEGYFGKNPYKNEAGSLYYRLTTFVEKADFERFMGTLYNELKGGEGVSNLARRAGFDGVMAEGFKRGENFLAEAVAFDPTQIKSATGNTGDFDGSNPDIRYSKASQAIKSAVGAVTGAENRIVGASNRQYDQAQRQFFKNVGRDVERKNIIGRTLDYLRSDFWKKMAVGVVDQFRGLRDLNDNGQAYLLARLSKGTAGAFDALLNHGKLSIRDGVYDADTSGGFLQRLGITLNGEIDDFLWWTAANRAEKLSKQDRENLFTAQDIAAGKSLASGTTDFDYTVQTGPLKGKVTRNRAVIYADANRVFNEFQKNALDMAEQSGLIDGSTRHLWESEFYVPFYRVSDEDGEFVGAKMGNALVRQSAFKKLKGGTDKLNADLLANTLMNWSHLIEASAKNRAAKASLEAAGKMGAAQRVASTMGEYAQSNGSMLPPGTKGAVWYMDGGNKVEYLVSDPFVMTAITSLEYAGMRNAVMDVMSKFKHYLTIGVTANPAFKIRNLIRDSIQAIGTSDLGYNPITNIKEGIRTTKRDSQEYVSALASGGLIRFGTMLENSEADRVRQLIKSGVKDSTILNNESKLRAFYDQYLEPAVAAYNELGNRSEEINRAALYNQLIKQGKSHAEAALLARDLMDFSLQGSFTTIRFLSQVVPFFNARLQGMYKLGRSTKDNPAKLATVIGACAVASIALMLGYDDDEDWKRREDFDRDGYFWFKFGGLEWRIPKPFEVGAVASLAERTLEYMINDEMTGERYRKVVSDLVKNNLSMNPVPQVIKPIIDLYANKDSFTGRPIETMNMQRLEPEMRFNSQTSMVARGLSNATAGALSPVQYDHIARAYFGWLGSFAVGMGDMAARAVSDEPEKPTADYFKLGSFGFAKEAGTGSSRYVSMIYDQAKELEQAYATYRQLVKDGKMGEAQEYMEDNKDKLSRYRSTEAVKKAESRLNEQIRLVEKSNLSADEKRERINAINKQKEQVAMRLAPGLN